MLEAKMKEDTVTELTGKEFDSYIKNGTVLIDFFAEWCMPCLMMAPVIDELAEKYNGKIKFGKVNIDSEGALANKYGIRSIPNFVLFKDGKMIDQFVGAMSEENFDGKLKKFV